MELADVLTAIRQRSGTGATMGQLKGMLNITDTEADRPRVWKLVAFVAQLVHDNLAHGLTLNGVYCYYAGRWKPTPGGTRAQA